MPTQSTAEMKALPPASLSCDHIGSVVHGELPAAQLKPTATSGRPAAVRAVRAAGTPWAIALITPG